MSETRKDWDDARLEAAFEARARRAGSPPPGFAESIIEGIEPGPARRPMMPWAAAAVGVALVVTLAVAVGVRPGPIVPTSASMTPGSPGTAAPNPTTASLDPLGGPIDVPAALAIRDGSGANDRELAVAGFLSPLPTLACPAIFGPRNPTRIQCPQSFQWLMKDPEITMTASGGGPPRGPAFHPSFALVDAPDVPIPASGAFEPVPVVLVGHFHDRRAELCPADRDGEPKCSDTFVVDRVASVNGEPRGVVTALRNQRFDDATQQQVTEQPKDLVEDVDALALAQVSGGSVLSRELITIDQVTGAEPVLATDEIVPHIGNPATIFWLVTVLDPGAQPPVARTFILLDGSNWFGEVEADRVMMLDRGAVGLSGTPAPVAPSGDPAAFDQAPVTVAGIDVRDIAATMAAKRADLNDLGRDELAVRGWFLGPDPAASCEALPAVHAPSPPCDAARSWLLDRPEQFGHEPGQLRSNPDHWPPVLNPVVPVDVPFDVGPTWSGGVPTPEPVVVLGHFLDNRVTTYAGSNYFVVDAIGWTRRGPAASLDSLVRLTPAATEDAAAVRARIDAISPNDAVATWLTAIDSADFEDFAGWAARDATEFRSGAPVWIVRRLVHDQTDGRSRVAIEWAYTSDHGTRVWWTETPDSPADLATSIDVRDVDARTPFVRVFDYGQQIEGVTTTDGLGTLSWKRVGPDPVVGLAVARGRSNREIAIRWLGGACDTSWAIRVRNLTNGKILVELGALRGRCERDGTVREIVLRFDQTVDLDRFRTGDPCCG